MPEIVIIGGPNGAGKTTASPRMLPVFGIRQFVNADEIARGRRRTIRNILRLQLDGSCWMRELISSRRSFAFETTCAGRAYLPMLQKCKADGWRVTLVYLWLPSPDVALERVAQRVRRGGYNIPNDVIVRRYWVGLSNMRLLYLPLGMSPRFTIMRTGRAC
jgi:predicted ABC-type ATPase